MSAPLSVGIDLIEIDAGPRARSSATATASRERCFTAAERAYCDSKPNPAQHYAGRFAAKEAVGKALGSGVYFTWREIEIRGRPQAAASSSAAGRPRAPSASARARSSSR